VSRLVEVTEKWLVAKQANARMERQNRQRRSAGRRSSKLAWRFRIFGMIVEVKSIRAAVYIIIYALLLRNII
jgi:hypothetical protein